MKGGAAERSGKAPRREPEPEEDYDDYGGDGGDGGDDRPRRRGSGGKKAVLIIAIVLAVLCAAGAGAGFALRGTDKIFPNVSVGGVNVGGMTQEQAVKTLNDSGWEEKGDENVTVPLAGGVEITVNARQAGAVPSSEDAAAEAYEYGRSGNPFSSLFKYVRGMFSSAGVTGGVVSLDEDYIRSQISAGVDDMNSALKGETYDVDKDNAVLKVVKGSSDVTVDQAAVLALVEDALKSGNFGEVKYDYQTGSAQELDINELHDKVCTEAKNASYDSASGTVTESVNGVEFDVDAAQKLWDAAAVGDTVEIPLKITEPKITTDDLSSKLFKDKLGSQVSYFKSSSANRINNITLAAQKIDGTILNPGEEFSYNGTVGQRTEAAGFKKAGAYANGAVVQEIGGGICQVSSTLYCAALYANLEITDRTCHYFPVNYLPAGLDATVSWKTPDFKFKNNRDYPVKLVAKVDNSAKSITIEVWGSDVDGSYVELKYSTWKYYDTKYPSVALGFKATTYRNLFDKDGNLISSTKEATSTYHYHSENIVYPSASVSPSASPSATTPPQATQTPAPTAETPVTTEEPNSGYMP